MTTISEKTVLNPLAIAYYNEQVAKGSDKIYLFGDNVDWVGVEAPYFNQQLDLCKDYYNQRSWSPTGTSSHYYAFITQESENTGKSNKGKYKLEVVDYQENDDEWDETCETCPKTVGYFDTAGEAMAMAVELNNPYVGLAL